MGRCQCRQIDTEWRERARERERGEIDRGKYIERERERGEEDREKYTQGESREEREWIDENDGKEIQIGETGRDREKERGTERDR